MKKTYKPIKEIIFGITAILLPITPLIIYETNEKNLNDLIEYLEPDKGQYQELYYLRSYLEKDRNPLEKIFTIHSRDYAKERLEEWNPGSKK
jgi:uncharacterized Fe-S cluster-containing radical SAM superfamily enzyme